MFPRLLLIALLPALLAAKDRWIALKSGPFEVFSNVGEKPARETLMFLEQYRETLRVITGKQDMRLVWPVHVIISKDAPADPKPFALARDARMMTASESGEFSRQSLMELARILLYDNTNHLPPDIEHGVIELVSTLEVDGPRITLGTPVPEAERTRGWAMMHLLTSNPAYAGRLSVLLSNLEQSDDFDAACHNAFEKTAAQINQETDAYFKAGNFPTTMLSGRALSLTRDFKPVQLGADDERIAEADLLLAEGQTAEAAAAYKAIQGPAGLEGQALLALRDQKDDDARRELRGALDGGSQSARAWLEAGVLDSDMTELKGASNLNPRWAEPYYQMAQVDDAVDKEHLEKRAAFLKKAANLAPRNMTYWVALAKNDVAAEDFAGAQKAWAGAERAAANEKEREHIRQVRLSLNAERFDAEAAERKREADAAAADLARVKAQSEAAIHAAEETARKKLNPNGEAPPTPQAWYHAAPVSGASLQGQFVRLDCLDGQQARFVIQGADGKTVQLLVADPSAISTSGSQEALSCGPQKHPRDVLVHYNPRANAKLHTAGEVTTIEFH
ncbi:MAG TPA: hypothetical protein VME17_06320 [Bryobacteraceae bacterium]|nr:hypothetical protein [Bryobacteraceae bacterium]